MNGKLVYRSLLIRHRAPMNYLFAFDDRVRDELTINFICCSLLPWIVCICVYWISYANHWTKVLFETNRVRLLTIKVEIKNEKRSDCISVRVKGERTRAHFANRFLICSVSAHFLSTNANYSLSFWISYTRVRRTRRRQTKLSFVATRITFKFTKIEFYGLKRHQQKW